MWYLIHASKLAIEELFIDRCFISCCGSDNHGENINTCILVEYSAIYYNTGEYREGGGVGRGGGGGCHI